MGIISAIIVLGVLVFVHELGHFLVAKFFGVGVLEFALGFGPVLTRFQFGETTYTIRAVPLGGFVRMAGDDPTLVSSEGKSEAEMIEQAASGASPIEGSQEQLTPVQEKMVRDSSRWFLKKPYGPRCAIVLAGPLFNFLFAFVLASGMYYITGLPKVIDGPVTVSGVSKGMPAEAAGMKVGDRILTVNGEVIESYDELIDIVRGSGGKPLVISVERQKTEGQGAEAAADRVELVINPQAGNPELDALEGTSPDKPTYRIGIAPAFKFEYEDVGFNTAMSAGAQQVVGLSLQTLRVLKGLLTGLINPQKAIGGPIEIIKQTAASANEGWIAIISMMIFLNVTLGVMNLLPIPVLDGGHLVLFTCEFLRGKPLSMRFQEYAMKVGMTLLLLLMVFAIGNDIRRLIPPSWF
jgi:regulator of sigma E protease